LEVPIFRPQFGALGVEYFTEASQQRFGNLHANCCGDATFLAAAQATWFSEDKWRMTRPPKIHPIDFNEFGDVVAKWVAGIQAAFVTNLMKTNVAPSPVQYEQIQCQLTLQETCILLRNVLMTAFKETQAGVHGLYPIVPASENDNTFVPFIVGTNTCFLTPSDMSLPTYLIENIRALVGRSCHRGGFDWEYFIPALGQWSEDTLLETDYFYTIPGSGVQIPSFLPSSEIGKRKVYNEKGEVAFAPLVEEVISLIDGSCTSGQACINEPKALKQLSDLWENWFSKSGVAEFSTNVGVLGTEDGINALTSINMSRVCGDVTNTKVLQAMVDRKEKNKNVIDTRFSSKKLISPLVAQPYTNVFALLDTQQSKMIATAYEEIQSIWILPTIRTRVDARNIITPVRWQAIQDEPYSQSKILDTEGLTLDSLHSAYAMKMVRANLQPNKTWDDLFVHLSEQGRGGIISGLVSKFADAVIPGSGQLVRDVGGALGI
jgi:hypothetical protein